MDNEEKEQRASFEKACEQSFKLIGSSTVFFGLHTSSYRDSAYCMAQLGFAMMTDKPIYLLMPEGVMLSGHLKKIISGWEWYKEGDMTSFQQASDRLHAQMKKDGLL